MNATLFLSIFSAIGIVYFLIGLFASKDISDNEDYFLAGRSLGFASVTATLIATQLGGNLLIGIADQSYTLGYYGILYAIGMSLGFLLLASGFAAKLQACNVATTAEIFEKRYNSPLLKKIASFISILSLCGIMVSVIVASKAMLNGLGIDNEFIFILFWLFVIAYTIVGGLKAVVLTDIFQVIFIIASIGGIFFYCLIAQPRGLLPIAQLARQQIAFSTDGLTFSKMLATFLMPALFSLIEQDLAQRFFAARSQRVAFLSALCSGLFIILFGFIPVYFGMQAQLLGVTIPAGGSAFVALLEYVTHDLVFILSICGIMAAITSTADSLLCAISSNIAQDFDLSFTNIKNKLFLSQLVTLLAGVGTVVASYTADKNIIDIAIRSYELSVSCLLVPILISLFKEKVSKKAAFCSTILGLTGFVLFRFYPIFLPKEIATLGLSLLGFGIGTLLEKN